MDTLDHIREIAYKTRDEYNEYTLEQQLLAWAILQLNGCRQSLDKISQEYTGEL